MLKGILDKFKEVENGIELERCFVTESLADARRLLAIPDMRPGTFDVSVEAWLDRISLWGKVKVEYYDPDLRRKRKVGEKEFIRLLANPNFLKAFGKWDIKKLDVNKIVISREFLGLDRKKKKEKFFVNIDLKKALR